jgi:hypothetical protein
MTNDVLDLLAQPTRHENLEALSWQIPVALLREHRVLTGEEVIQVESCLQAWKESADARKEQLPSHPSIVDGLAHLIRLRLKSHFSPDTAPDIARWLSEYEDARCSPYRCSTRVAVDWGDRAEIATLELVLAKARASDVSPQAGAAKLHPAYRFAYRHAMELPLIDIHMNSAFDLAKCVCDVNNLNWKGYWRLHVGDRPLSSAKGSPPTGDSATGGAFYGWGMLIRKLKEEQSRSREVGTRRELTQEEAASVVSKVQSAVASIVVLARVSDRSVVGFHEGAAASSFNGEQDHTHVGASVVLETLRRKSHAVAAHREIKTVVVASEMDAAVVYSALQDKGAHARIDIRYPGVLVSATSSR